LFRLALRTAEAADADPGVQRQILTRLAGEIAALPDESVSPQVGLRIQEIVQELSGVADPYRDVKRRCNELALKRLPALARMIDEAGDPLLLAIRLAVAGNVIDFAVGPGFDLDRAIRESLEWEFDVFDYEPFKDALAASRKVLYIGDNAGEVVFDRLLVEQLLRRDLGVTFAVRGGPAINDAMLDDARDAGMDELVQVITTGTALPGVILPETGERFRAAFERADLVISKGQGNFEGLCDEPTRIAFLLRAKCAPVARLLGVETGALVLRCREAGT
jgi:uncharacterized protein with ATP-grasp and redox domains